MLVANSFDLWQKDSFFSAAEEVQQSADIMESAYRTWLRARKEGSQHLDELCRELQMALGTAKWQLEEFERAVRLSYGKHVDDVTITRHRQFVSALEEQISHVEAAVKESFNVERKKPFRWVNIAEEECDDFAQFLSGTPGAHSVKDESISLESGASSTFSNKYYMKEDCSLGSEISSKTQISSCGKNLEVALSNGTAKRYMDLEERKRSEMGDELLCQAEKNTNHLRTWSSPDGSALEIVIDCDDRQKNALIEATPKEKGSKPSFWRSRREHPGTEGRMLSHFHSKITDWICQRLRSGHRSQRQQQISPVLPVNSLRFILALMLTIFLVGKDIYDVLSAIVPLYVAMILAYGSVRWWKIFTPDQCSGINRFVAVFAVPLLGFHFISTNNIYTMNFHFIAADSLQKIVILGALFLWQSFSKNGTLEWMITLFSLSTLPNTLVMGIPLLKAMYGEFSGDLMVQIVVMQSVIWYTLMLFMFEYRGAKMLITDQFPETAATITSFKVESDVISLNGREPLQADAEIGDDGKLHVVVRRSTSASMISSFNKGIHSSAITPRASNLTGVEIYSLQSSREPTPRASSFNQSDFYAMFGNRTASPKHEHAKNTSLGGEVFSLQSSKGHTPRTSNFEEESVKSIGKKIVNGSLQPSYPPPNPLFSGHRRKESGNNNSTNPNKELHMFVWSSSASPVSDDNMKNAVNKGASNDFSGIGSVPSRENGSPAKKMISGGKEVEIEDVVKFPTSVSPYLCRKKMDPEEGRIAEKKTQMPPASVVTRLILIMVWRKLIRNPNTYASLIGLVWSLISFRWNIEMPSIVKGSISILSDAGLGMAMFSLGLFMALRPKIIACGKSVATFSMAVRFLTGPAVIAATSIAIGLRGVLLHVAIVQAALPQGIVPFVFAKEYNVHPDILSTTVIFGMLIALPITILYYVLLGV